MSPAQTAQVLIPHQDVRGTSSVDSKPCTNSLSRRNFERRGSEREPILIHRRAEPIGPDRWGVPLFGAAEGRLERVLWPSFRPHRNFMLAYAGNRRDVLFWSSMGRAN